jgi:hypothetical protein
MIEAYTITELFDIINEQKKEIATLRAENTRLQCEIIANKLKITEE